MKQFYTLLLILPAMLFAQTDIDFQSISSGLPGPNWTWTADQTDTSFDAVDNPFATGINTSSKVGELTAAAGSVAYALAYSDGIGSFTFDANNTTVKIMVYKSRISPIEIKFEDASDASVSVSRTVSNTVINDWEELTFDFYSTIGNTSYGKIVIIPDNLARTEANITYFDNITFTAGVAPVGPSVAAPTPPTRDAADVVSFYSDAYATAAMEEYFPSWMVGTVSDNPIDGNNTWKMDGLGFAALANYGGIDLSTMEKMYIDYYTTQDVVGAKLFVKLIDTNDSQEVLLDLGAVTAGSWQTVEVDLTAQNTANIDLSTVTQFLIDPSTDGDTFFIDNWYFSKGSPTTPATAPTTAPAAPTLDAADVISFYSDSYTNIAFGEYFPSWSEATVTDYPIDGNSIWKMEALNFASVTQYAGVDLSGMNKMYIDYWTTQDVVGAKLFVKLVDTNDSQEVLLDLGAVTAGSWQTVEVDLTAQNTANIDLSTVTQFLIDPSTDGGTFFIDNWYFANVPEPGPSAAAPTPPARNAADVISLYSDAYTDVASNFDAGWCGPNSVSEISVAGNATTAYLGNVCQGIVLNAGVDASAFTNLHVDIYIEAGTDLTSSVFNLKFVNQPGGNALEMNLNVASSPALIEGQWLSVDLTVDLTNFTGFKEFGVTSNLNNKVWYDNLYAYKGTPLGINEVNSFSVVTYPNPVENTLNVSAGISVDSVSIFDITGREVLRAKPNATAFSLDVADLNKGLYLVTVKAGKQEITTKLVK
jgi:hypothetical protein